MTEFTRDFLIRIIADNQKARTDIDYTRKQLLTLDDTAARVGGRLGDIERVARIDQLSQEMATLAKKTGDVDAAVVQLTERLHQMGASTSEIDRATSAFATAQDAASAGGGGGLQTSQLTQFGNKLRQLPSIRIPGTEQGTDALANVVRLIGAIPPVALPAVAALGAVGAAFVIMNKGLDDGRKALAAAIDAENAYYKAVTDLTTAQAKQQIADLQRRNDAIRDQTEKEAKVAADGAKQAADSFSGVTEIIRLIGGDTAAYGAKLVEAKATTGEVTDNIDALNKEYDKNQVEIDKLTQGLNANAFAANDAAEAEKALASIRDQLADDTIARAKRDADLKRSGTAEQIQAQIDDLQTTNDAINQVLADVASGARTLSPDKIAAYNTELEKNKIDIEDLTNNILKFGIANDTAKKNAKDAEAAQKDLDKVKAEAIADDKKRSEDIDAINAKTAAAYTKLADAYKQAGDAAKLAAQQADDKTARTRADEDVKTKLDREAKLADVDSDAAQKEVDAEVKKQETLAKIRAEFSFDEANAVQDRDAVALDAAKRKRDKATDEAKSDAEQDQKQIVEDREKRLKELRKEFDLQDKETKLNRAAQDRETEIARDQDSEARRQKYLRDQNDLATAQRADLLARNQAYTKQISDLNTYLQTQIKSQAGYYGDILAYATKLKSDLNSVLKGGAIPSSISGVGIADKVPFSAGRLTPTQFDTGGKTKYGGYARLDPGEIVLTPQQQRGMMGGVSVSVNGVGLNKAGVIREVVTQLNNLLDHAGAA